MQSTSDRWVSLGEPASAAEAEALNRVRELLPDDGVSHAWSNLTFVDTNGNTAEVDVLLVSRVGVFVLELKGWYGRISGDQQSFELVAAPGRPPVFERNPYILADQKAKRLASLLRTIAPPQAQRVVPFIGAKVILHGRNSQVDLPGVASSGILALDGYNVTGLAEEANLSRFLTTPPRNPNHLIEPSHAGQIAALIKAAGFVPTPLVRKVGQYTITSAEHLAEGTGWHDVEAKHPDMPGLARRIRIFELPRGASTEDRAELERSAQRELALTSGVRHPGIEGPFDMVRSDFGPALIFEHDPAAQPLDAYIGANAASLTFADRLALLRQIAEVLAYAHSRRLTHRALSPLRVRIVTHDGTPQVRIRDWWTGRKSPASTARATARPTVTALAGGVADVTRWVEQDQWPYLAPELLRGSQEPPPVPLDVYGFGALAYLVLTGQPPGAHLAEVIDRVNAGQPLDAAKVSPELPESVVALIAAATSPNELDRPATMQDVLERLSAIEAGTLAEAPVPVAVVDPLEAPSGAMVGGRFAVRFRRGRGSTGTALLVDDVTQQLENVVLKLARDDAAARRLTGEARVLAHLDHPRIVQAIEGPLDVDGRQALLLSDAGQATLAQRLAAEGRCTLEQLENYGRDLLDAVGHLEERGVFHRDIKPANLGVAPDRGTRKPRLTLFDFSLAPEPLENIGAGTPGYLDPFLGKGRRRQYDRAAELWSVAVTLFEMSRGELPTWHRGDGAPAGPDDRVVVLPDMFEDAVGEALAAFFTRALHPDATARFANVGDLARAWYAVFAPLARGAAEEGEPDAVAAARDDAAARATLTTPLSEAGLSPRALSALQREDLATVSELITTSGLRINSIPGLGEQYRREIQARVRQWRDRLLSREETTRVERAEPGEKWLGVEGVAELLVPRPSPANVVEVRALRSLLALDGVPATAWPTVQQLATAVDAPRAEVVSALDNAARRWRRNPEFAQVRDLLVSVIAAQGGVVGAEEAAAALTFRLGSAREGDARRAVATGLVRAVVEGDVRSQVPSLVTRRLTDDAGVTRTVMLAVSDDAAVEAAVSGEAALDMAALLGEVADRLAETRSVTAPGRAAEEVRGAAAGALPASAQLGDDRLLRIATAAAARAALSSRGELYPRDLDPAEAVVLALRGITARTLTRERARERVIGRFPVVGPLPEGPAFDQLVMKAVPALHWDGQRYSQKEFTQTPSTTAVTSLGGPLVSVPAADAVLRDSLRRHSALTLAVHPRLHADCVAALAGRYGVQVVDVAAIVVREMRRAAAAHQAKWEAVVGLDSRLEDPRSGAILQSLAREAMAGPWSRLAERDEPLLLVHAGLLARYGLTDLLAQFFDLARPRPAARWMLLTRRASEGAPTLDGRPAPLGPDGWVDLPPALCVPVEENAS